MFFNVKLPWNHLASILLTPDNRMMYSLYQYALGKDSIEIEVNSFLFWLIPLWAVSFWDSYAKILEGWYRREHIHSTMQIHTCRAGDAHSTSPRSGAKIGIPLFFFFFFNLWNAFLLWGDLPSLSVQSWARRLVSEHWGITMIWHKEPPCHWKQGHRETAARDWSQCTSGLLRHMVHLDMHICI